MPVSQLRTNLLGEEYGVTSKLFQVPYLKHIVDIERAHLSQQLLERHSLRSVLIFAEIAL